MKKILILTAIVALAASAACTKNTIDSVVQDEIISFQVANYVPQTKTNVVFEGTSFHTYAWYNNGGVSDPDQVFMNDEQVKLQDVSPKAYWAPDRAYFWPKNGHVNFFSYAGTQNVSSMTDSDGDVDVRYGTYSGSPLAPASYLTIATTDDIMLASAAYRYQSSNASDDLISDNYGTSYPANTTGVPALFHHLLAQVAFQVRFDASGITAPGYAWNLQVNSVTLNYANKGALRVEFEDPGTDHTLIWPYSTPAVGWDAKPSDNADLVGNHTNVAVNKASDDISVDDDGDPLTPAVTVHSTKVGNASHASGAGESLMDYKIVLPQDLSETGATLTVNYTLTSYYSTNPGTVDYVQHIEETVDTGALDLDEFTTTYGGSTPLTAWNMNYKYLYTITIKPNKIVTFDPAVVDWESTPETGFYTYPND